MHKLLKNNCIMTVLFDDHTKSTGKVDFYGGEQYHGELHNALPSGKGTLRTTDGSTYEGHFNSSGLITGKYTHFTQNVFVGKFVKDKLKAGKIEFRDGDVFKGIWGVKRGKWIVNSGVLFDESENEVGRFDKNNGRKEIRSKLKCVFREDGDEGFCVRYDYFCDFDCKKYSQMVISGHGFSLTKEIGGKKVTVERERSFALVPYEKIDIVNGEEFERNYRLPFGFNIKILNHAEICEVSFDHVEGIFAKGVFDFTKRCIYFSGNLKKKEQILAKLEIKKSIFSKLVIKIDGRKLRDLRSFYINLVEFMDVKKYLPSKTVVKSRISTEKNVKAMGNIIDGIKEENECTIF